MDSTIPLYSLAITSTGVLIGGIWGGIKFYFKVNAMQETLKEHKKEATDTEKSQQKLMESLEERLDKVRKEAQLQIDAHKKETDREFERINRKLDTQNNTLIEVKTMVSLLVQDKIKK